MAKNHWVVSRPKRKLILVPTLIKIFSSVAEGEPWRGNRSLHLRFEENLTNAYWKAQNISKDGSGGRTYAVLLFMLGLWYEDDNGVQITNAGKELIAGNSPVPIITKQLLDFQYPSPYSIKSKVNVAKDFRIRPHRFVLRLFLEEGYSEITQDEIAFCLVPFAKRDGDIKSCASLIQKNRINPDLSISSAVKSSGTTEDNLRNIGNTIVNQLEYSGFFKEQDEIRKLELKDNKRRDAEKFLQERRKTLIQDPTNTASFQRKYGIGLSKSKDYRDTIKKPQVIDPTEKLILERFYIISATNPILRISSELINQISTSLGVPITAVRKVLDTFPVNLNLNQFEQMFLQLAIGGKSTATEFERRTSGIFSKEGFGYESIWVGNKPRNPDVIVFSKVIEVVHGIIDTKAYSDYSLPLDHKNKMAYTYIQDFNELEHEGEVSTLKFFSYVAGGYSQTINKSFSELLNMTDIPGSFVTAETLIKLLRQHKQSEISIEEFFELFSSNGEIIHEETE